MTVNRIGTRVRFYAFDCQNLIHKCMRTSRIFWCHRICVYTCPLFTDYVNRIGMEMVYESVNDIFICMKRLWFWVIGDLVRRMIWKNKLQELVLCYVKIFVLGNYHFIRNIRFEFGYVALLDRK